METQIQTQAPDSRPNPWREVPPSAEVTQFAAEQGTSAVGHIAMTPEAAVDPSTHIQEALVTNFQERRAKHLEAVEQQAKDERMQKAIADFNDQLHGSRHSQQFRSLKNNR